MNFARLSPRLIAILPFTCSARRSPPAAERHRIFRRDGGRLQAAACKVVAYSYFADLLQLLPRDDVLKAARQLLDLALDDYGAESYPPGIQSALDIKKEIRRLLRLKSPYAHE